MNSLALSVACRGLKKSPVMAGLMVLGLALGLGMYVTAHGSHRAFRDADLEPVRHVFHVSVDRGYQLPPPMDQDRLFGFAQRPNLLLSWRDAEALSHLPSVARLFGARAILQAGGAERVASVRFAAPNLLSMFHVPTVTGVPMDEGAPLDAVWVEAALQRLWPEGQLAVGKRLMIDGVPRTIVGVVDVPRDHPPLFELSWFSQPGVFLPLSAFAELRTVPSDHVAWGDDPTSFEALLASDTPFVDTWAELPNDASREALTAHLSAHLAAQAPSTQTPSGQTGPARAVVLRPIAEWHAKVSVPHPAMALFEVFSAVALVAAVFGLSRLLLAQFSSRSHEVGLRRALGACPRRIFGEHLLEASMIGVAGGLLGIALGALGLELMTKVIPFDTVELQLSWAHALRGLGLAMAAATFAALVPARRAATTSPARAMGRS